MTSVTLVLAHRGVRQLDGAGLPENSLRAFAAAVALDAAGVELDVRFGAGGALVVMHDDHLADGRAVAELAAADLPEDVCLLPEALAACGDLLVNVEIKADAPGTGAALAAPVVAAVEAWGGRVVVSSFDPATIDEVRRLAPEMPTGQLTLVPDRPIDELVDWVAERGHRAWHPWHPALDQAAVERAHEAGLVVATWTVNEPERIAQLAGWGVDAVITDDVALAQAALSQR